MRRLHNWVFFALLSIILIAIILRLIKLYEFALWGSDSGEHYFLLNRLTELGEIQFNYNGWGLAYPFFPGMYLLSSGFALSSGCSSYYAFIYVTPISAALSVLLIFCIAHRVFRDLRVGLLAAGYLAVILPHVFTTSHPMPGSLGSFLMLACVFLIFKSYDNSKFLLPLVLTALALIITHHMSTYFLIILLVFIILFRELLQYPQDRLRTKYDFGILTFLVNATLIYWVFYAESFRESILSRGLPIPLWSLIPAANMFLIVLYMVIYTRRRFNWKFEVKFFNVKSLLLRIIILIIASIIIMSISGFVNVPGTNLQTSPMAVLLFLPIIILLSFMAATPAIFVHYKDGISIFAWLLAICVSFIFSVITNSQELLSYRHIPYAFEPLSILAGLGVVKIFDLLLLKKDTQLILTEQNSELLIPKAKMRTKQNVNSRIKNKVPLRFRFTITGFIIILLILCGIFSYPPLNVVSGFEEGTTDEEFDSVYWARDQLADGATIASDHRMSSMMFGFAGVNGSWDSAYETFHSKSFSEMEAEALQISVPAGNKRLDYILITDAIENGVALKQWEPAESMNDEAVKKFDNSPFIKLYDNGEARIYYIDF